MLHWVLGLTAYTGFSYFGHVKDHTCSTYFKHFLLHHEPQTSKTAHVQVSPKPFKVMQRIYINILKLAVETFLLKA